MDRVSVRRSQWPALLSLALAGLYLLAIAGDWAPFLRGNADWRWAWLGWPPLKNFIPLVAVGAGYLALVYRWERDDTGAHIHRRLLAVAAGGLVLQLATLLIRYPHPFRLLYDLTASDSINGYHTVAAGISDIGEFLRGYPALMPRLPNHVTTHPPGVVLLFWGTGQLLGRVPPLAHALADRFRVLGCMHAWVSSADDVALAGGAFGYLMPPVGMLTVFPLYHLGKQLYGRRVAWRSAALFPLVPAFVLNAGQADQMYPFFITSAALLFDYGLREERGWPLFWAGVLLSWGSFMSLGLAASLLLLALYALFLVARGTVRLSPRLMARLLAFVVGLATVWLVYWGATGVNPAAIWQGGLGRHIGLERPYGRWVLFNLVDFLPFTGVALILAALPGMWGLFRRPGEAWSPAVLLAVSLLDLSGLTRGEVSRLWLFLTPAVVLAAAASLTLWGGKGLFRAVGTLLLLQLALFGALIADPHPRFYEMRTWPRELPPVQHTVEAVFGDVLELAGYDLDSPQVSPGGTLDLTLYWRTLARPEGRYKVFTHLYDERADELAGQHDKVLFHGDWPTTCWAPGEVYRATFHIPVREDAPPGEYLLLTGFYDETSGVRLPVRQAGFPEDTRAVLTTVRVQGK